MHDGAQGRGSGQGVVPLRPHFPSICLMLRFNSPFMREEGVDGRHDIERQNRGENQPTNNGDAERLAAAGGCSERKRNRQDAGGKFLSHCHLYLDVGLQKIQRSPKSFSNGGDD